jgi:rhodanese-related sulfurtransferase
VEFFSQLIEFIGNHPLLCGAFVLLLVALVVTEGSKGGSNIGPAEVIAKINRQGATVIDVRDKKAFNKGHIAGARNIPLNGLGNKMSDLEKFRDKPLVLVCESGQHAGFAGRNLRKAGFDVYRLRGGMGTWRAENLPME